MATSVYFVGGVSATIPPIKKYVYHGEFNQFKEALRTYAKSDTSFSFKTDAGSGGIDIDLRRLGKNLEYGLECRSLNDNTTDTEIDLVMAFNTTNNIGGYGIEAVGMKDLLNYFDNKVIAKLQKDQHSLINVKKEGFFERINIY